MLSSPSCQGQRVSGDETRAVGRVGKRPATNLTPCCRHGRNCFSVLQPSDPVDPLSATLAERIALARAAMRIGLPVALGGYLAAAVETLAPARLRYGAGAGIVADSDPHEEWQETLHKAGWLTGLGIDAGGRDRNGVTA